MVVKETITQGQGENAGRRSQDLISKTKWKRKETNQQKTIKGRARVLAV